MKTGAKRICPGCGETVKSEGGCSSGCQYSPERKELLSADLEMPFCGDEYCSHCIFFETNDCPRIQVELDQEISIILQKDDDKFPLL